MIAILYAAIRPMQDTAAAISEGKSREDHLKEKKGERFRSSENAILKLRVQLFLRNILQLDNAMQLDVYL